MTRVKDMSRRQQKAVFANMENSSSKSVFKSEADRKAVIKRELGQRSQKQILSDAGFKIGEKVNTRFGIGEIEGATADGLISVNDSKGKRIADFSPNSITRLPLRVQIHRDSAKKDSDGDGVPDSKDCQPHNPKKQDDTAGVRGIYALALAKKNKELVAKYGTSDLKKIKAIRARKDSDGDGVPDSKDCEPHNPKKQGTSEWTVYGAFGTSKKFKSKSKAELYAKGAPERVIIKTKR